MLLFGNPNASMVEYNPPRVQERRVVTPEMNYFVEDRQKRILTEEKRNSPPSQYFGDTSFRNSAYESPRTKKGCNDFCYNNQSNCRATCSSR